MTYSFVCKCVFRSFVSSNGYCNCLNNWSAELLLLNVLKRLSFVIWSVFLFYINFFWCFSLKVDVLLTYLIKFSKCTFNSYLSCIYISNSSIYLITSCCWLSGNYFILSIMSCYTIDNSSSYFRLNTLVLSMHMGNSLVFTSSEFKLQLLLSFINWLCCSSDNAIQLSPLKSSLS